MFELNIRIVRANFCGVLSHFMATKLSVPLHTSLMILSSCSTVAEWLSKAVEEKDGNPLDFSSWREEDIWANQENPGCKQGWLQEAPVSWRTGGEAHLVSCLDIHSSYWPCPVWKGEQVSKMLEARKPFWIPPYQKMAPGRLERALGGVGTLLDVTLRMFRELRSFLSHFTLSLSELSLVSGVVGSGCCELWHLALGCAGAELWHGVNQY